MLADIKKENKPINATFKEEAGLIFTDQEKEQVIANDKGINKGKLKTITINPDELIWWYVNKDGVKEKKYHTESILAYLLEEGIIFSNNFEFMYDHYPEWKLTNKEKPKQSGGRTIVLFVNCSDIFAWGSAEAENITINELEELWDMHYNVPKWGSSKWCCKKRNEQPQFPVARDMKKDGSWEDWMDKLEENYYDKACRERSEKELVSLFRAKTARATKKYSKLSLAEGLEKLKKSEEHLLLKIRTKKEIQSFYFRSWYKPNLTETEIAVWRRYQDNTGKHCYEDKKINLLEIKEILNITNKEVYKDK